MNFTRIISLMLVLAMLTIAIASCNLGGGDVDPTTSITPTTTQKPDDSTTTQKPDPDPDPDPDRVLTVAEAIEIAMAETSTNPTTRYYIRATIVKVSNPAYGEMTIADETGEIYVYGVYSADGAIGYANFEEKPVKGDEVLLHCTLNTYNGTPQVKNGRLIEFTPGQKEDIDASAYTEMSIADAREVELGTKVSVTGVVARITYANGYKPSGFYLVDETQSIYVYDGDAAQRVQIGNKVTVIGSKTYWILDTEQNNAQKFGYKGCNQISDAKLISIDEGKYEFDKSWITESTVKDILDTPVTEDITTTIFKVNGLVKKVPGSGFVNYYIFDIDGETGAYTYTQCNGGDFEWLDEFDVKICTVYLSAMNAKSTATDCYFRFLPVHVVYENYQFDTTKAPEYAVKYHGVGQFLNSYSGNPELSLITSVSSELLGFENVTLTYTSSNTNCVYFENGVMNCAGSGEATVTITATYGDYTYSETVVITVDAPLNIDFVNVETAIGAAEDEVIYVKGIVGPSIVNKSGFYLIDETGVIAIICDAAQFDGLMIGHEVIVKGTRENYKNDKELARFGQTCLVDAEIVANYYGNHSYSTASFITDKTLADFASLNIAEDHTTTVYVIEATIQVTEGQYSSTINIVDNNGNKILLYSSSANQYSWLKAYDGKTVALEVVPCNWNNKNDNYRGCVLALYGEGGIEYNKLNFTAYN